MCSTLRLSMVNYGGVPHPYHRACTPDDIHRSRLTPNEKHQCKTRKEKKETNIYLIGSRTKTSHILAHNL